MKKFLKTLPSKLWILLFAAVIFTFFSNDFGLVDIQKTAIILAAGIDRTEQGFSVTAQIAVPDSSDRTKGGTSSVNIEAEGATVSDCISRIYSKTGWVPKLVFCNLIVMGEEAVKEDVVSYLNYFLRNEYMPDSCLLAVCAGTAHELLVSESAIDDSSSIAVTKLFSEEAKKSGKVLVTSLKDFAIGYYGVSESGYLPFVRMTEQVHAGEKKDETRPEEERRMIYSAEETAIFSHGRMVALLPREQTLAFSMLQGNVFAGTFNARDGDEPVTLSVLTNDGGVKLSFSRGPRVEFSLDLRVRLCCRGLAASMDDIAGDEVKGEILASAEEILSGYVRDLYETATESGCDLFHLRRDLYRSSLSRYAEWKEALPAAAVPSYRVRVHSTK